MTSKFALVIANTEYQDASFAKLTAPGRDAEEFAQVLRDTECAAFDDVQVLLNEGEGRTRRSIARFFAERKRDDLLLLYFSGHGVRNEVGQLFLAANDTEINILEASGIPAEFVTQSMNNSRSQRQLLILDCCNSGAFAYGSKSTSAVGKSMGIASAFEGSGFGRVVLTATDATQYAWEGDKVIGDTQKSVFTHFLIEGLKGEADRDGDGRIHVDELYDYAYEQVVRRTPKQTPGKWSYKQQGEIILRENLKPREVKPAPLPSDLVELLSHPNSGVRRAGLQDLISLLDGKHLGLARGAEEKLREIADNDDSLTLRRTAGDTLIARGLTLEQPAHSPVEIPREKQREEKHALTTEGRAEGNIEKPARMPPLPSGDREAPRRGGRGEGVLPRKIPEQKKVIPTFSPRLIGGIAGGLLLITLCIWGGASLLNNLPVSAPEPTRTSQPTATRASQPTKINTPTPTQVSISPTPALDIGSTIISDKDNMILLYVPADEFTMGSETNDDEKPIHKVNLDAFWIDQTEVTNQKYSLCVEADVCKEPINKRSFDRSRYYGDGDFDNYPVIYVDWNMAKTYCEWARRRLPTEAEWEKAARGIGGRFYPWSGSAPTVSLLNYKSNVGDTTEVGKYPDGASPYGAVDMAGNVGEWVADWYSDTYYQRSLLTNPPGPDIGEYRVVRGGSWISDNNSVRSTYRNWFPPTATNNILGFRCAMSAIP